MRQWKKIMMCAALAACGAGAAVASTQKVVVADFEDFGTWRMRDSKGMLPGAVWPMDANLSGTDREKFHGDAVGELKFHFDPEGRGPFYAGFDRYKMSLVSGFIDGIEFDANANGLPVMMRFQIVDGGGEKFTTRPVALSGTGWQHYRIDFTPETVPNLARCKFPARLHRIILDSPTPTQGTVYLDDIALTGTFAKKDRLRVAPVYEKISFGPEENVLLRYRVRNGTDKELSGTAALVVKDFEGREVFSEEQKIKLDASGEAGLTFDIGRHPLGAYEGLLVVKAGGLVTDLQDPFVVMEPNNGRPNKRPMWFGICDQTVWQGDLENQRHREWMHLLGIDIDRLGLSSNRLEFNPDRVMESWRKVIKDHADSGIDILALYDTVPAWTQTKPEWRGPADKWPEFEDHARKLATMLKDEPNVRYLEFWNEPDVEFYHGTFPQFLEMIQHFSKVFREVAPGIAITSPGLTVKHPREKPGFSKAMYQEGAPYYDVAAYHSHGPAINNQANQEQVEAWLKEKDVRRQIINTETGDRSFYSVDGRRRQAIALVKKIVYSKSNPDFDAYFWFTLQDYWDMDPDADDSFGLVTSDNRAKPSFAAYNTLIRQLANTTPFPSELPAGDLTLHAFRKDDGHSIYVGWPGNSKSNGILWIKSDSRITTSDIFGRTREYNPLGGVVPVPFGELPQYVAGGTGDAPLKPAAEDERFLSVDTEVRFTSAGNIAIPVRFRNPTSAPLSGVLKLGDSHGTTLASKAFQTAPGESIEWTPSIDARKVARTVLNLTLSVADKEGAEYAFPINFIESYPIGKVALLGADPKSWPDFDAAPAIVLDRRDQVQEMAYDPNTAPWGGPDDLSAIARVAHDDKGIRFQIKVTDNIAGPAQARDRMFKGDDVQVSFAATNAGKFAVLDLGQSIDGPTVWCSEHPESSQVGPWNVPLSITKQGQVTTYDVYLPYEKLAIPADAQDVRFTFLVNENDGNGRVRWIEWTSGIARDRTLESLGYGTLK